MEKQKKQERAVIKSLLDLPEFRPEIAQVHLPRLNIVLALRETPYDKLMKIRREEDAQLHLILASVTNHPELKQEAWYREKMHCATPVDGLKKLLRLGEVEKICRAIDLLNGYGSGSVTPVSDEELMGRAIQAAVEELEKN